MMVGVSAEIEPPVVLNLGYIRPSPAVEASHFSLRRLDFSRLQVAAQVWARWVERCSVLSHDPAELVSLVIKPMGKRQENKCTAIRTPDEKMCFFCIFALRDRTYVSIWGTVVHNSRYFNMLQRAFFESWKIFFSSVVRGSLPSVHRVVYEAIVSEDR